MSPQVDRGLTARGACRPCRPNRAKGARGHHLGSPWPAHAAFPSQAPVPTEGTDSRAPRSLPPPPPPQPIARPLRRARTPAGLAPTRDSLEPRLLSSSPRRVVAKSRLSSQPTAVAFWERRRGRRYARTHLPYLLSAASPHLARLCSLEGCAAQNVGDSRPGTASLERRRTRKTPSNHARRSLPAHSRLCLRARQLRRLVWFPRRRRARAPYAHLPPVSLDVHTPTCDRRLVPQAVAAMCDDTPNTPPRREGKKKKRTFGLHKRGRNSEERTYRGMSKRWTNACSSKSGMLRASGGKEVMGK